MFNHHYVNIVENSTGVAPSELGTPSDPNLDSKTVEEILKHYENHPSIKEIKKLVKKNETFTFPKAKTEDINKIINSLNPKKATGPDSIPIKIIKVASKIIDSHLTNAINEDLDIDNYSDSGKIASVKPLYKKDERSKIKNYRPVSILNAFSKIYERYLHNCLTPFVNEVLSNFICAYRKSFGTNHGLIRLIEDFGKNL